MVARSYIAAALTAALLGVSAGCADTAGPDESDERFDSGSTSGFRAPISYSSDPVGRTGPTEIRTLLDANRDDFVWLGYGSGDPYPTGRERAFGDNGTVCETEFGNRVYELSELPATIEGIATLVPRHFQSPSLCGQEHRFFGSYYIQDSTGSILVLRDSHIPDFDFGDRVRLRVRGLLKSFGTMKVTAAENVEVERDRGPAPFRSVERSFREVFGGTPCEDLAFPDEPIPEGLGDSYRVAGKVCQPPTTRNFGALTIVPRDADCSGDPETQWRASLGVELDPRVLDLDAGESVEVTGPVTCSFGEYTMAISSFAQFRQFRTSEGSN